MPNSTKLHVQRISHEIKDSLSSRLRQVEPGCLVKVPLARIIGETNASGTFFSYMALVDKNGIIVSYRNHAPTM